MSRRSDLYYYQEDIVEDIRNNLPLTYIMNKYNIDYYSLKGFLKEINIEYNGNLTRKGLEKIESLPLENHKDDDIDFNLLKIKRIKEYLFENNYKEYKCESCGISSWNEKEITLQLHHKDGNHSNNKLSNLVILCPNCHSQTHDFCRMKSGVNNLLYKKIISNNWEELKSFSLDIELLQNKLTEFDKNLTVKNFFSLLNSIQREEINKFKRTCYNEQKEKEKRLNEEKLKKIIEESNQKKESYLKDLFEKLKESNIDFSKLGWINKSAKYLNISVNDLHSFINLYKPDFLEKAMYHTVGEKNSSFGTCWINDGKLNKKIKKEYLDEWINIGWKRGRINVFTNTSELNKNRIWIHLGDTSKQIDKTKADEYLSKGWLLGRTTKVYK